MSKKKKQAPAKKGFQHEGHAKPVTRRDFLAQGLIDLSTLVFVPSLLDTLLSSHVAHAAGSCAAGGASGLMPFLVFDMAGGGALMGNFVPMSKAGSPLATYSAMGLGVQPTFDTRFGVPMAGQKRGALVSKIMQGILETSTPEAQSMLRMGLIAHQGISDSSDNLNNAAMHVAKAGLSGLLVRGPVGTNNSRSGGNTDTTLYDAAIKPLQVRSVADMQNALNYGPALSSLPPAQLRSIAQATLKLSQEQAKKFKAMTLGEQFATLSECGFTKNVDFASPVSSIDPRSDAMYQRIYGINTGSNNRNSQIATIVKNVLEGNSGPGTITIGGCDYHSGNSTDGDAKDLETGREIGRAIQAAFELKKPVAFQIVTDGGISSDDGTGASTTDAERIWRGDSNGKSMTIFGVMNPAGVPKQLRTQIGYYTSGQQAATDTFVGGDTRNVAHAVFANYLAVNRRLDLLDKIVPAGTIPSGVLDSLLLFG